MTSKNKIPRGIRNNNPLNIRVGNNWLGEVESPSDPSFEQFKEMAFGVRAGFIVLRNYILRHKCNTIRKIITRWAPNNENNTAAYINFVAAKVGVSPDFKIDGNNGILMIRLFTAMCEMENGCNIDMGAIIQGWIMARRNTRKA